MSYWTSNRERIDGIVKKGGKKKKTIGKYGYFSIRRRDNRLKSKTECAG